MKTESTGIEFLAIVREYFPDLPDCDLGFILWNETAFPLNILRDGREEPLRRQLAALVKTLEDDPEYVLGGISMAEKAKRSGGEEGKEPGEDASAKPSPSAQASGRLKSGYGIHPGPGGREGPQAQTEALPKVQGNVPVNAASEQALPTLERTEAAVSPLRIDAHLPGPS